MIAILLLYELLHFAVAYNVQPRFGHSAVLVNDSIYFYGGDSTISSSANNLSQWISDLSILPIHSAYSLTDLPWKPASGPQDTIGGPIVYSHIAFMGGIGNGDMIVIGGVMPQADKYTTDEGLTAYSYDCDLGRWNSFSLPSGNHLNRQGAACTTTEHGIAYIWGGKRASVAPLPPSNANATRPSLSASMYKFDSFYPSNSTVIETNRVLTPPLRYGHTQTLLSNNKIVVLGGFDSNTGDATSLSDAWVYDILTSTWSQVQAKLDREDKPAARSSHSQVLMPDGFSILVYGGYDGYHVYNDVAVLDTRTWTWTVKNTNAVVQGRADHTATLVGTNMIVAFGFTGVSTSLSVMADIEVLDTLTWSWTSVYTPSTGYSIGGVGGKLNGTRGKWPEETSSNSSSSSSGAPSIAIVAGAITGGLVVFLLVVVASYLLYSYYRKKKNRKTKDTSSDSSSDISFESHIIIGRASHQQNGHNNGINYPLYTPPHYPKYSSSDHEVSEVKFTDPPSSTEPFEYYQSASRRPSNQIPHPLQINTNVPIRSDTIGTATTVGSSVMLLPSPWSPVKSKTTKETNKHVSYSPAKPNPTQSSDWMIRRAASIPTQYPMQSLTSSISKPDDRFYPNTTQLKRAVTVGQLTKIPSSANIWDGGDEEEEGKDTNLSARNDSTANTIVVHDRSSVDRALNLSLFASKKQEQVPTNNIINSNTRTTITTDAEEGYDDDEEDVLFDRQEFILQSDEVEKIDNETLRNNSI